jgi:hypothetical protein
MDHAELAHFRRAHPAWRLLRSDNAPLVLGFLGRVFVEANASDIPAPVLVEALDDELYALNQRLGEGTYPRPASAYLDEWADPERGWLRKHYPSGSDEAHYDVSPAVEKALLWVEDLRPREFIGTESRLNTVFELLRQIVHGSDTDPQRRLEGLQRERAQIDAAIERAQRGDLDLLDAVGRRDRYQQLARTARELLSDFRAVEENFRHLDRNLRERIAGWAGSKGELLDEVVGSRSTIAESDQGRSFRAFYDFLLSADRQTELTDLLGRLAEIEADVDFDARLSRIHFDWIDASERTQATVRLLSEQLRRFLDDQVWLENRRVVDLVRGIEAKALAARGGADRIITEIDATRIEVVLPTERPLHARTARPPLQSAVPEAGGEEFDSSALFEQAHVSREFLLGAVLGSFRRQSQVALEDVVERHPLQQGLAELVGYLALCEPGLDVVFDEDGRARITWKAPDTERTADVPRVTFARRPSEAR